MRRQLRAFARRYERLFRAGRASACRAANVRGGQQLPDQLLRHARQRLAAPAALAADPAPHDLVALKIDDVQRDADRGLAVDADLVAPLVDRAVDRVARALHLRPLLGLDVDLALGRLEQGVLAQR